MNQTLNQPFITIITFSISKGAKMYKKNTKELEKQLVHTHPSKISEYIHENETEILSGDRDFMNYMNERIKEKGH